MAFVSALPLEAQAAGLRRRFDPDDLELDQPGVMHADLAFGVVQGQHGGRWLIPDFDIDLGLATNVELGLDGAWAIEGKPGANFTFDHRAPDNLWANSKVMLYDKKIDGRKDLGWAFGLQLGPRFATAPGTRGVGFQALGLLGGQHHRFHGVLNGGALVDAGGSISRDRPTAVLVGIDSGLDLDAKGTWSIIADFGGVFFFSRDASQLEMTFGPVYAVAPWLDVAVNGLVGFLVGGDHYGAYLQLSPKLPIF
jgi:hypothetical protein